MHEYSLTRGGKILVLVLLLPMLACSILGALVPFFIDTPDRNSMFVGILSPVGVIFFGYWLFRVNEKFIVDSYSIRHQARFINRELLLQDIQGYRVDDHYLHLVPFPGRGKKIKVSNWVGNFGDLHDWAASRFPDLDNAPARQSYEAPGLDDDPAAAGKRIMQARTELYILNGLIVILGLLPWLLDGNFWWIPYVLILCLLAAIFMLKRHKGIVQLADVKKSPGPSMLLPALLSCGILYLGARNIHVLQYDHVWTPVIVITLILAGLMYYCGSHLEWKKMPTAVSAGVLLLCFFGGSFALALQLNRITARSAPEYFEAQVINKRISKRKTTTYYLELSPWGPQTSTEEVSVPYDVYDNVNVNERVAVHLYTGGLGIPWYAVTLQ
jgi:hypothetical protein